MKVFIAAISYYLPEQKLTNEMLVQEFPEWSVEKVTSKIGISERHIAAKNETAGDLAVKAAGELFKENRINRNDIGFLLLCTQSPDYFLPTTACLLQEKLGLPTSCGAIDFNLGCSGFVYGLSLAKGLICAGITKNVLLLTAETYSKYIHSKDKGNRSIFGDAATATLISSNEGFAEILNFSLGTDGRGADNLIVKSGGLRKRNHYNDLTFDGEGNPKSSDHLFMDGSEIFNFTLESVPILVAKTLEINNIKKEVIDLFVFHQANQYMMNFLRKKIQIDEAKFYYCLEKFGNTVSSTIPIALKEAKQENCLKGNVLIAGFGVGYSWGGTILRVNNLVSSL
jgi:3-oxoacyl-[acyl-carrier-protein] synthase III